MEDVKQKTVLVVEVVEDEPTYQRILTEKLIKEGFGVIRAKDGAIGLEDALAKHPDIILLDIMMPVMDGVEMLRKLRTSGEWGSTVPVFILTNVSSPDNEAMQSLAEFAPTYYFEKTDTSVDSLVEKIREQLGSASL